ncbi:DUF1499 domain-containing protein [Aliihoeflea sp. PC F10.4]
MARYDERQFAPLAAPARGVAFFAAVLLGLAVLAHWLAAIGTPEFFWVLIIVAVLALFSLLLAGLALRRVWIEGDAGAGAAIAGVLIAGLVLAPFAFALYAAAAYPALSDVATDTADPPLFTEAGALRGDAANRVMPISPDAAAAIRSAYPELVSRIYDLPLADAVQAALRVASERGLEPISRQQMGANETTLEFASRSLMALSPADIALRLRADNGVTRIDMRSASQYGSHDLGDNARRIAGFLDALDYEVGVMQGVIVEDE